MSNEVLSSLVVARVPATDTGLCASCGSSSMLTPSGAIRASATMIKIQSRRDNSWTPLCESCARALLVLLAVTLDAPSDIFRAARESAHAVAVAARDVRVAQRAYFSTRDNDRLAESKRVERALDTKLALYFSQFGDASNAEISANIEQKRPSST